MEVELFNFERTRSKRVKALVDTGTSLSVLPKSLAEELGIKGGERRQGNDWGWPIKDKQGQGLDKAIGQRKPFRRVAL